VTITGDDGTARRYGPGDMIFFPAGSVADWRIESHVKKLAFCQVPAPMLLRLPLKAWRRLCALAGTIPQLLRVQFSDTRISETPQLEDATPSQRRKIRT